jgi:hypothetical protein
VLPNYRHVERLLRRVKARWRGTPFCETHVTYSISSVKVTLTNIDGDSNVKEITWADVIEAVAYKRDCFAVDLMCVALVGHGNVLEVNEQMKGWNELLDHLTDYLPGCRGKDKWYPEVMFPPLKENRTLIFSRR